MGACRSQVCIIQIWVFKGEVWENLEKVVHIGAQWWLVQVILDCKEICAPESLKVQLTKLLTENNVLYYNLPLPTKICPIIQSF